MSWVIESTQDFPGGAVDASVPARAGDAGSSPDLVRIPHAVEQLGLSATAAEAHGPGDSVTQQEKPLPTATRKGPGEATKTQHSQN